MRNDMGTRPDFMESINRKNVDGRVYNSTRNVLLANVLPTSVQSYKGLCAICAWASGHGDETKEKHVYLSYIQYLSIGIGCYSIYILYTIIIIHMLKKEYKINEFLFRGI